jgi:hypothetical protein
MAADRGRILRSLPRQLGRKRLPLTMTQLLALGHEAERGNEIAIRSRPERLCMCAALIHERHGTVSSVGFPFSFFLLENSLA